MQSMTSTPPPSTYQHACDHGAGTTVDNNNNLLDNNNNNNSNNNNGNSGNNDKVLQPSKVVHLRNVNQSVTQSDLVLLTSPFGTITHVLRLKNNQVLIQFTTVEAASKFVNYYKTIQAKIRGRNIYVSFSSHSELQKGLIATTPSAEEKQPAEGKSRILLVSIYNAQFMITIEIVHQVFSYYGNIEKIVLFNKLAGLQALVQFSTVQEAVQAKKALQGRSVFGNQFTLSIQFSNLENLTVNQNTDKTRDFTNPNLRSNLPNAHQTMSQFPIMHHPLIKPEETKTVLLVSNLSEKMDCNKLFNLFSCYGFVLRVKIFFSKRDHALVQMIDENACMAAISSLKGLEVFGKKMQVNFSKHGFIASNENTYNDDLTKDFTHSSLNRPPKGKRKYMCHPTTMLHISNLSLKEGEQLDTQAVIDAFTPFGKVIGAKTFDHNGRPMALVKFAEVTAAAEAIATVNHSNLLGSTTPVRLSFSLNNL